MEQRFLEFNDNRRLAELYGVGRKNLSDLEKLLAIDIIDRGNILKLSGDKKNIMLAEKILRGIYDQQLSSDDIRTTIRTITDNDNAAIDESVINVRGRRIQLRTANQKKFLQVMRDKDLSFGVGAAGSGKTYLAVAYGLSLLTSGAIERMIITRPVVEAGENLGFLPGDLTEKIDPYLRPIDDAASEIIGQDQMKKLKESGQIEIAPLAYMRGRTLKKAFILLDEAQNTKRMQMKMFLTRLGERSKMVITGDGSQTDLARRDEAGLKDALKKLANFPEVGVVEFGIDDVQRHALVGKIIAAYQEDSEK
ncbi:MAG: PhoH family protein [Hydrotalea sp.]|nr:PhoH family protein [Hydrotalea sp.]